MSNDKEKPQDSPRFGLLLLACGVAVLICALITWVMSTYFPDFPNF